MELGLKISQLAELLSLLRENGVSRFQSGDLVVEFGASVSNTTDVEGKPSTQVDRGEKDLEKDPAYVQAVAMLPPHLAPFFKVE